MHACVRARPLSRHLYYWFIHFLNCESLRVQSLTFFFFFCDDSSVWLVWVPEETEGGLEGGCQGSQLSDPPPGAVRALLLPPLAHVIEGEEQQTCRQRFDYIFHASVQWKKRGLWGGHRLKKSLISNVHGIHARPRLGAAIPWRRVETHPGPLRYLFAALALSRTSAPDKTSLCLFVCVCVCVHLCI